jgi:peptidyl-prolyl cis-trans isomerase C
MSKILKEPLLYLIVAGVLLYIAYVSFNNYLNKEENILLITNNEILMLEDGWQKRMNRPPTPEERQGLINQQIREMVLYKTGLEMGLDRNDQVIRRRMVQKVEFMGTDLIRAPQPTEQELISFFEEVKERYTPPETITMTQVFFDPDKRNDQTLIDAEKALVELNKKKINSDELSKYGDSFMLQSYYPNKTKMEIRKLFGNGFTASVFELEPGQWEGPVLSGYGTHLVYIHAHEKNTVPEYADVREKVKADWMDKKQKELNDKYIDELMARYEIVFEDESNKSL